MKKIFTLFLLLLVVTTGAKAADPVQVNDVATLISTVNEAEADVVIKLAAGEYNLTGSGTAMTIPAGISVTIIGAGADKTIIDGGWSGEGINTGIQIFNLEEETASLTMEGVTLQRGRSEAGGAIFNDGSVTLRDCVLKKNFAAEGGAIASLGALTVINCVLIDNEAIVIGGAIAAGGSSLIINTTITGNKIDEIDGINLPVIGGGGLSVNENGEVIILNSIIVGNTAKDVEDDIYNKGTITMVYSAYGEYKDGDENVLADGIENLSDILAINVLDTTSDFPKAKGDAATKGTLTAYDGTHGYYYDKRIPQAGSLRSAEPRGWTSFTAGAFDEKYILRPDKPTIMGAVLIEKEVEPVPHHELTFLVDEGIRINPDKTGYHIEEGHDYTFYMYMNAGNEDKKPYVTVNGQPVVINPTQDGTGWVYRIPAVYEDKTIEIVLQDLTDNLNPEEAGVVIYSSAGALIVDVAQSTSLTIYNITGQAVAQQTVEGRASFNLPKGIYIVKADGKATKAVVR